MSAFEPLRGSLVRAILQEVATEEGPRNWQIVCEESGEEKRSS